jgi:hypothetical protein
MRLVAPNSYAARGLSLPSLRAPAMPAVRADSSTANNTFNFSTPPPGQVNDGQGNYYEALRVSQDRTQIPYAMVHLRPQILRLLNGLNRKMLAGVARYLVDNGGIPSYAVNTIANYSCPVRSHSECPDKAAAKLYDDYFDAFQERADFTNRFDFEELQHMGCVAIDTDGDIGATVTDESGFPQVRFFDTFHIGTLTGLDPQDGVVTDQRGRLLGYKVVDGPVETLQSIANRFMPIGQMRLIGDSARYDHYRYFSPIRRGSNDLRDAADIKAFVKLKEKISAALAAVIQQKGVLETDVWGDDTQSDGTPNPANSPDATDPKFSSKLSLARLLGGDIPIIEGELKQFQTNNPGVNSIEFLQFLAGQFVAGLDLPPAFFLDEKLTGPNVRAVLNKVQKKFDKRKRVMARFVRFVRTRVIAWGIANDGLPAVPGWDRIGFQFPPLIAIDLGDVMNGERADVMCGQMSEKERFANRGRDRQTEASQIADEIRDKLTTAVELVNEFKDQGVEIPIGPILTRLGFGPVAIPTQPEAADKEDKTETDKKEEDTKTA